MEVIGNGPREEPGPHLVRRLGHVGSAPTRSSLPLRVEVLSRGAVVVEGQALVPSMQLAGIRRAFLQTRIDALADELDLMVRVDVSSGDEVGHMARAEPTVGPISPRPTARPRTSPEAAVQWAAGPD